MITASDDDTIKLWRASDGALLDTLTGHTDKVVTLAVSLRDGALASGALDGTIKIWDLHERRVVKEIAQKGGADVPKDNVVQAEELSAYVSNLVRKLTDDSQQPVFSESGGKDFVIGTVRGTEPVPSASR